MKCSTEGNIKDDLLSTEDNIKDEVLFIIDNIKDEVLSTEGNKKDEVLDNKKKEIKKIRLEIANDGYRGMTPHLPDLTYKLPINISNYFMISIVQI